MDECEANMQKAIEYYQEELKGLRTNRPSASMLNTVKLEVYGTPMRMRDVATVSISDGQQLMVTPFDPSTANSIAKGIEKANLNLNPIVDGNIVRVPIPPMSEERRKEIAKEAREKAEKTKIMIREARRKANEKNKKDKDAGEITEDVLKGNEKHIQKLTDTFCKKVDTLFSEKESALLAV